MAEQTVTVRELILHIIPGVALDTESQAILAIEACRIALDSGSIPSDPMTEAFDRWYESEFSA